MSVSTSSGAHVEEFTRNDSCDECGYHGLVDCWFDPELGYGGFDCPVCTTSHTRYPEGN